MHRDVHCSNDEHIKAIDNYAEKVFESLDLTAKQALPNICGNKKTESSNPKKNIPGWTATVKPFKEDAMFWKSIWVSLGKPLNT